MTSKVNIIFQLLHSMSELYLHGFVSLPYPGDSQHPPAPDHPGSQSAQSKDIFQTEERSGYCQDACPRHHCLWGL